MQATVPASRVRGNRKPDSSSNASPPATATRGPTPYRIRQHSDLNRRGHEILAVAERLFVLIRELEDSNAGGHLSLALAKAFDISPDDCCQLDIVPQELQGFSWSLEMIISVLDTALYPLPTSPRKSR